MSECVCVCVPACVQIQYLDANTYQYLGYTLSRAQKERLVARWAADYPELSESKTHTHTHTHAHTHTHTHTQRYA